MAGRWDRLEADKWRALRRMSAAESIRLGEELMTSDLMRLARPRPGPRPPSLAKSLGLLNRARPRR